MLKEDNLTNGFGRRPRYNTMKIIPYRSYLGPVNLHLVQGTRKQNVQRASTINQYTIYSAVVDGGLDHDREATCRVEGIGHSPFSKEMVISDHFGSLLTRGGSIEFTSHLTALSCRFDSYADDPP